MNNNYKKLKWVLITLVLLLMLLLAYKYLPGKEEVAVNGREDQALTLAPGSQSFNSSFNKLLDHYEAISLALSIADTAKANQEAALLVLAADSLNLEELKADTTGALKSLAQDLSKSISAEGQGLSAETGLVQKRRELELISDQIWNLARALQFKGAKIYYYLTSKAFDGQGSYWISRGTQEKDPFTGEMVTGNSVITDSLNFK